MQSRTADAPGVDSPGNDRLGDALQNVDLTPQALSQARTLPAALYSDGRIAMLERTAVFARHWQYLGHTSELRDAQDTLLTELVGIPVIVARTPGGFLAHHAVCRHRAGPLETCRGGGRTFLRCRYHGWSYDLEGRLLDAPEMRRAKEFDPKNYSLPRIEVSVFHGLLFGRWTAETPPLTDGLEGISARLAAAGHDLERLRFHERVNYDIDCNWKTYIDNYLEGYHVPHVHPTLDDILDYRSYTTELGRCYSLQSSPLRSSPDAYGSGEALYYFIYPNTMLNILPGRLQTNRVLPLRGNRCRVQFDFLYLGPSNPTDRGFSDQVQQEDIAICEAVQRNLDGGSYQSGPLNPDRESGLWHFQELLRRDYKAAITAAAADASPP